MERKFPEIPGPGPAVTSRRFWAAVLLLPGLLAGCETIEEKYGPREIRIPKPVGETVAPDPGSPGELKPAGLETPGRRGPRDALVAPEFDFGRAAAVPRPGERVAVSTEADGDLVSLNLVDASVLEAVDAVLGRTLGLNYVFDERVEGRVTARTTSPIPRGSVLPMLENILALNGAALVQSGGVYNVVPLTSAPSLPKLVVTPARFAQRAGVATFVIPLEFATAASMQEVIGAQVSPGSQLAADPVRNILIFTGPSGEAQSVLDMVSVLDVDVLAGTSFALFPVELTDAFQVAAELEELFAADAARGAESPIRFLPVERLNAVLAVSRSPSHLRRAGDWVRRLDRADAGAGRRVFVYHARNSRAADLVAVLSGVFDVDGGTAGAGTGAGSPFAPGSEPVDIVPLTAEGTPESGTPAPQPASLRSAASALATAGGGDAGFRVVAVEARNALVIVATDSEYRMVESILASVDTVPLQVLIEATIAEVTLTDDLKYGLQWAFENGDFRGSLTSNAAGIVGPAFPGFNLILEGSQVQVVLNALADATDIEVVSSPQLVVLDNQPAKLQVGDQIPVLSQTAQSNDDPADRTVNQVRYVDTGVILEVTPRVNATGLVTLEIVQEVSDAIGTTVANIDSPTIQQRRVQSIVAVHSGQTVALGGLIRERAEETENGVPILMDIPILGNLFKTTGRNSARTELLVLITPRVIRGAGEAREVTEELRKRLTTLRPLVAQAQ